MQVLEKASGTRAFNLDLIRAAAGVLVLAVHFFLNTGFYSAPLRGSTMLVGTWLRMACMTCVPLFLTLTGYLCGKRRWSWGYYRKLLPVLLTYLLAACACLFFRMGIQGEPMSPLSVIRRLLDFSATPYGWYLEMYIGLFLLTPFLNAMWYTLEKNGRKVLRLTLIVMTALPAVTNLFGQILPDWWSGVYPLTYYVLGARLREHPVQLRWRWLLAGWRWRPRWERSNLVSPTVSRSPGRRAVTGEASLCWGRRCAFFPACTPAQGSVAPGRCAGA